MAEVNRFSDTKIVGHVIRWRVKYPLNINLALVLSTKLNHGHIVESDGWSCEQFIHFGSRLQSVEACLADAHLEKVSCPWHEVCECPDLWRLKQRRGFALTQQQCLSGDTEERYPQSIDRSGFTPATRLQRSVGQRKAKKCISVVWTGKEIKEEVYESLVYADKPQMRILRVLTIWKTTFAVLLPIYGHKCWKKVIENWTSRLDYIRASRGSPMPEIIFKM
ncbi:hypothetical protein TNCV_4702411 [Trichonephila clavipes]|nr:hypothetical protein TNCV_4702411 [Trichonephila clavipes]